MMTVNCWTINSGEISFIVVFLRSTSYSNDKRIRFLDLREMKARRPNDIQCYVQKILN